MGRKAVITGHSLLGKIPDSQLAEQLGVNPMSVAAARIKAGLPSVTGAKSPQYSWDKNGHLLGTMPDRELAARLAMSTSAVSQARKRRGIAPFGYAVINRPVATSDDSMMRASAYISAARRLRELVDRIEATANAETAREKQARTRAINAAAQHARRLFEKNARIDHA